MTVASASVAEMPVDVLDLDAALRGLEAMDAEQVRIVGSSTSGFGDSRPPAAAAIFGYL